MKDLYSIVVIGAGQLGSRHLQGLKKSSLPLSVFVVDPSEVSLKIAKERLEQIGDKSAPKTFSFFHSIDDIPNLFFDLAIIATSSKPRADITKSLLQKYHIDNIIFEKFLFPNKLCYSEIGKILSEKGVKAWVNCPRRLYDCYNIIKSKIDIGHQISMSFSGIDWGLCCNAIHFIDLFMFLVNENTFVMNNNDLEPEILQSKRDGYIELRGTINCYTPNGNSLSLSSLKCESGKNGNSISQIIIKNGDNIFLVNEGQRCMSINGNRETISVPFQSDLTGIIADTILSQKKQCPLASFKESSLYHLIFLSAIQSFLRDRMGWNSDVCPIT